MKRKRIVEETLELYKRGRYDEALTLVRDNLDDLFDEDPEFCIQIDIDLCLEKGMVLEAKEDLARMQEKPYVRQQVEEALREASKKIDRAISALSEQRKGKPRKKALAYEEDMDDKEIAALFSAHSAFRKGDAPFLIALLQDVKRDLGLRTGALITLVELGYEKEVSFWKNGEEWRVVPAATHAPGDYPQFKELLKEVSKKPHNEYGDIPKRILFQLEVMIYPAKIMELGEKELLLSGVDSLCRLAFQRPLGELSEEQEEILHRLYELSYQKPFPKNGGLPSA